MGTWQLFRRVLSAEMPRRGAVAVYDAAKNILFIDAGRFDQMGELDQQQALTCKDVYFA